MTKPEAIERVLSELKFRIDTLNDNKNVIHLILQANGSVTIGSGQTIPNAYKLL